MDVLCKYSGRNILNCFNVEYYFNYLNEYDCDEMLYRNDFNQCKLTIFVALCMEIILMKIEKTF